MFDAVRNNKRIVQGFLALITLPFAFWGIDSYIRSGGGHAEVAKVGSVVISQAEFQKALQEQKDALRVRMGDQFDPTLLARPELREQLVSELVNRSLLNQEAERLRLFVGDRVLGQFIASIPDFQEGGRFSKARYEALVAAQNMSVEQFEASLRRDLMLQQLMGTIGQTGWVSRAISDRIMQVQTQVRQVQELPFPAERYLPRVKLDANAVQAYYEQHSKDFELPEQVRVEYVLLSGQTLRSQVTVSEAELKAAYEAGQSRWMEPEERRASHILIAVDAKAPAADLDKAKATAQDVLKQLRANPAQFADLAKKYSQDPGSARRGGDLGFFGKGAMVRPFEEAVWRLKEGEISEVVQSDFGLHIIRLTGIKGGKPRPFESVRGALETELRQQAQSRKFAEAAENFGNMVYEQSDSLQPAAEKYHLAIQTAGWFSRNSVPKDSPLAHPKALAEIFSDDAVKNRRNTAAIDLGHDTLLSARVVDYKPAALQPLDSVRAQIELVLKRQQALDLAKQASEETFTALQTGHDEGLAWAPAKEVSRMNARAIAPQGVAPVFQASAAKLPAYVRVDIPGLGQVIYKVLKVRDDALPEIERSRLELAVRQQLQGIWSQEEARNYLASLRQRYKVEINSAAISENNDR